MLAYKQAQILGLCCLHCVTQPLSTVTSEPCEIDHNASNVKTEYTLQKHLPAPIVKLY